MKKTIAKIILALMLLALTLSLFCACGKNVEVSKVNIIKANSTKTLLEKYGSFEFRLNSAQEECGYYIDNDMVYYCQGDYHEITSDGLQYGEDSNGSFVNFYAGVKMDLSYFECLAFAVETFAAEEIVSSKQNGDTITLKTKLTVAKLVLLG
ncbi:MAG: hypothetical protein IJW21_01085 [Clostridia bacterium]|nr:hypothetical protein [Clostridia bacterium]